VPQDTGRASLLCTLPVILQQCITLLAVAYIAEAELHVGHALSSDGTVKHPLVLVVLPACIAPCLVSCNTGSLSSGWHCSIM
jgi:hypothetical protein